MSREKGKRFEREVAGFLRDHGYDCRRGQQYNGADGSADVIGLPGIHIEAKHHEQMRLYDWMDQAKREAIAGELPAVFHRKNHCEMLVTMRAEDFMKVYRECEAGGGFEG